MNAPPEVAEESFANRPRLPPLMRPNAEAFATRREARPEPRRSWSHLPAAHRAGSGPDLVPLVEGGLNGCPVPAVAGAGVRPSGGSLAGGRRRRQGATGGWRCRLGADGQLHDDLVWPE